MDTRSGCAVSLTALSPLERAWWELSFGTKQRSVCLIVKELRPFPPGEILNFVLHSDPHKKTQDRTTAQCWKHVFFAAYNPRFFRKFLTPLENFLTPPDALVLKGLKNGHRGQISLWKIYINLPHTTKFLSVKWRLEIPSRLGGVWIHRFCSAPHPSAPLQVFWK